METTDTRLLSSVEDTEHRGWYDADHLPHFDVPGLVQHVTYHLADSLPKTAIRRVEESLDTLPTKQRKLKRRQRIQELLDSGLGSCILKRDDCAKIVESSFFFGHGSRYQLLAWVIMPNHVHVLIEQMEGWPLGKIVQSWKRHTAREINRINDTRPSRASSTTRPS